MSCPGSARLRRGWLRYPGLARVGWGQICRVGDTVRDTVVACARDDLSVRRDTFVSARAWILGRCVSASAGCEPVCRPARGPPTDCSHGPRRPRSPPFRCHLASSHPPGLSRRLRQRAPLPGPRPPRAQAPTAPGRTTVSEVRRRDPHSRTGSRHQPPSRQARGRERRATPRENQPSSVPVARERALLLRSEVTAQVPSRGAPRHRTSGPVRRVPPIAAAGEKRWPAPSTSPMLARTVRATGRPHGSRGLRSRPAPESAAVHPVPAALGPPWRTDVAENRRPQRYGTFG
jgi:hypothetical protein